MFRKALAHFQCSPENCLFIGDNPRWDILGARRAGMTPVFIDRTGEHTLEGEYQIDSLFDLEIIIERVGQAQ